MRPGLAEFRPSTGQLRWPECASSVSGSRWKNALGARRRRLAPSACLIALALQVAPAVAAWPAPPSTPIDSLRDRSYWPNDPSFAWGDYESIEQAKPGQWWLYSFVPARAASAMLLRQPGLASGLSVDAAWRYGTGKSNVILAVLDDGVDGLAPELAKSVVLNLGEMVHSPPVHKDRSPCAPLVPSDPTSPRFDCAVPADGEVTVEDFAEMLGWSSGNPGDRYDPNANGILDIYDIAQHYQNHRDDDNNGLDDDIIGWNFVESNSLPNHLTTRHGTEVALDALAGTNDGIGRAGVCPGCRLIPIRVADERGSDPQRLALGILYAASRGATAALVGHLPAGRSETLERALQNAAQRGTLVLFPQDGEQLSQAPVLFDLDAWLPIAGLTTRNDNNITTLTTSFVALDPCQTFAPGVNYVGAGPTCSRVAPSVVLGIAGLVASGSPASADTKKLTPLELSATLKWSADTIDTALTSVGDTAATPHPSLRRINANDAVEAARAGLVPPELNIERPYWYEPVVLDRLKSPISIIGRLSAPRAASVDLSVRVAYGRNPSDTELQELSAERGIDTKTTAAEGSTLATLDLRDKYKPSASPLDDAVDTGTEVTIRITATARHADGRSTTTEVERRVVVLEDPDLMPGAPLRIGSTPTAPKLAYVDGDNVSDIVFGTLDGRLMVLSGKDGRIAEATTKTLQTLPTNEFAQLLKLSPTASIFAGTPAFPSTLGRSSIPAAPAIADLDGDGQAEIVAATSDGHIYVVHADGTSPLAMGLPIELPAVSADCDLPTSDTQCELVSPRLERGISSSPVIADMNGDGLLDIVVAAHDGRVHAYGLDGKSLAGWPVLVGVGSGMMPGRLTQSPAVADFDGDSVNDLLVTAGEIRALAFARGMHVLVLGATVGGLPRVADGWPVGVDSLDLLADRLDRSTPGASIDSSNGTAQALLYGNSSQPFFLGLAPGETEESNPDERKDKLPTEAKPISQLDGRLGFDLSTMGTQSPQLGDTTFAPMLSRPSIGDLDRDGTADVVLPGLTFASLYSLRSNTNLEYRAMLGLFSGESGRMLPASPIELAGFVGTAGAALADLTNDGFPEVIIANGNGLVLALDACGRSVPGWPKVTGSRVSTTPAVGDIDGDGHLEVSVTTDDGWLFVWRTLGAAGSYIPWASALNDNLNQSNYLTSGSATAPKNPAPLRLDEAGRCHLPDTHKQNPPQSQLSARGGCGCRLPSHDRPSCPLSLTVLFGMAALLLGRRRANA